MEEIGYGATKDYYHRASFLFQALEQGNLTCESKQAHLLWMKVWLECNEISSCTCVYRG